MTLRNLIACLDQLKITFRTTNVLQLVSIPASRAKEIAAEVVDSRFNLGKFQINGASFAGPHGAPPCKKRNISMITNPAQITRQHLANQAAPAYSLIRKVCTCGKASTAKQLAQHGKCAACALAAVRDAIMPGDFAKLQHMLGAVQGKPKNRWGYRNYFAAGSKQQHDAMQRLMAAGLATAGRAANEMTYFHATRLGCKAAGLDGAGIKRALED